MTQRIVVGVTQRVDLIKDRGERRDALDQRLCHWISLAGHVPVPIPNVFGGLNEAGRLELFAWLELVSPGALLFSGGNDIGEAPERDKTENALLDWAAPRRTPVLGICRGMQMLGVAAGGKLKAVTRHAGTRHTIHGERMEDVNSFHNFSLAGCPSGYEVTARAEDGEIEAIRHKTLPWEGWMWHPEREPVPVSAQLRHLKALFGG